MDITDADMDSDSCYTTNQPDIVAHAKYCVEHYPTIVNNVPKDQNIYDSSLRSFAIVDNNVSASQTDIGESSNLAQLCLTYSYNFDDPKYENYVCILSVLAQLAIDSAKRRFCINTAEEIKLIKQNMNVKENKYPSFWLAIRKGFNKKNINKRLICPMNNIYNIKLQSYNPTTPTIPIEKYFNNCDYSKVVKVSKKIQQLIEKYSLNLYKYNINEQDENNDEYILLRYDFEELVSAIRQLSLGKKYQEIMCSLINQAFMITPGVKSRVNNIQRTTDKNKSLLLKTLYEVNPKTFIKCFKNATF